MSVNQDCRAGARFVGGAANREFYSKETVFPKFCRMQCVAQPLACKREGCAAFF